jgi:hypothetical protein
MSRRSTLVAVELPHLDLATFVLYVGLGEGGRASGKWNRTSDKRNASLQVETPHGAHHVLSMAERNP